MKIFKLIAILTCILLSYKSIACDCPGYTTYTRYTLSHDNSFKKIIPSNYITFLKNNPNIQGEYLALYINTVLTKSFVVDLGNTTITNKISSFYGWTVNQLLDTTYKVINHQSLYTTTYINTLKNTIILIDSNFSIEPKCNCVLDNGYLNCLTPLPVELINFSSRNNELIWTTASEINNDHFEVLYSSDGINFTYLGKVIGNGNSNNINNYSFPYKNNGYYRLKQVDFNGRYSYSPVIEINNDVVNNKSKNNILIYPNPSNGTNINISSEGILGMVSIYDITGKIIYTNYINSNSTILDNLNTGIYIVKTSYGNFKAIVW